MQVTAMRSEQKVLRHLNTSSNFSEIYSIINEDAKTP